MIIECFFFQCCLIFILYLIPRSFQSDMNDDIVYGSFHFILNNITNTKIKIENQWNIYKNATLSLYYSCDFGHFI